MKTVITALIVALGITAVALPASAAAPERIIDVVTLDDLHRAQGRERWREYTRLGHELVRHDLQQASTT